MAAPAPVSADSDADASSSSSDDEAMEELLEQILVDEPMADEEISDSPLDVLGEVSPELDAARLEQERELIESMVEPSFDIPMVTNEKVLFWVDYYSNRKSEQFQAGLVRSGRYVEQFRQIFGEQGLPLDLIFMAHVESGYKTTAYSRARARGIFQFITGTGRRYGLRIDYWVDERLDPEKSARAAAAYLKELYEEFGDWYLALAAYNAGEGKIRSAIRRSGRDDFWSISKTRYIRRETKNYVPAILAAVMISRQPERYGFTYDADPPFGYDSVEVEGAADLQVLARCAGTDLETMKRLNPSLRRYQTPPDATTLVHVPEGAAEQTSTALAAIPVRERVLYARHRVRPGDTLYELARAYGVSVSAIQQTNKMGRRTMIRVGDELIIPTIAASGYPAGSVADAGREVEAGEPFTYRVRRGDSLSAIAARYRTSAAALAGTNGIRLDSTLHPGDRLKVVPGVRNASEATRIASGGNAASEGSVAQAEGKGGEPATIPVRDGASPVAADPAVVMYRVRRGDTLWDIGRRYATTAAAIAEANGIGLNTPLRIGDTLRVYPAAEGSPATVRPRMHTVRRGETLWLIASRYATTVDALCALNSIAKDATLYPGTRLTIRRD